MAEFDMSVVQQGARLRRSPFYEATQRYGALVRGRGHAVDLAVCPQDRHQPPGPAFPPRDQARRALQVARTGAPDRPHVTPGHRARRLAATGLLPCALGWLGSSFDTSKRAVDPWVRRR